MAGKISVELSFLIDVDPNQASADAVEQAREMWLRAIEKNPHLHLLKLDMAYVHDRTLPQEG